MLDAHVERAERYAIEEALARAGGNRTLAARLLGVSCRTLYNRLTELQISWRVRRSLVQSGEP